MLLGKSPGGLMFALFRSALPKFLCLLSLLAVVVSSLSLAGCAAFPLFGPHYTSKECLMRAMFFESNQSSPEGMLAVGTVVMNRVGAPHYPNSICGVVLAQSQFSPNCQGATMRGSGVALASQMADRVLAGARHPALAYTTHFHTAGLTFPYKNMHYVLEAGGNAFYEIW
jgi:spore germination cell wall hydrolase CwlJ-like protein